MNTFLIVMAILYASVVVMELLAIALGLYPYTTTKTIARAVLGLTCALGMLSWIVVLLVTNGG